MARPIRQTPQQKAQAAKKRLPFTILSRLSRAAAKEFSLQSTYKLGYRNKEDVSNLPPNVLVVGSQNVLTNAAEQIVIRNGYQYDGGAGNQNTYGIDSAYDFQTKTGVIQNLRKWGPNLEVRTKNAAGAVSWTSLLSTLNAGNVCNFTNFYDSQNEQTTFALFVNGDNKVYEWTGAVGAYASATSASVTIQGTQTLAQHGFYNTSFNAGKMQFVLNGITYTYTSAGISSTAAFTGSGTTQDAITPTTWWAQQFTTGSSAQAIIQATLAIYWNPTGWTGNQTGAINFTGQLYTDNAGVPGTKVGGPVASSLYVSSAAGGYGGVLFDLRSIAPQGVSVAASTKYHFVVSSDQTQYLFIERDASSGQNTNTSTNSGATWSASNGPLNIVVTENNIQPQTFLGVTPDPTLAVHTVGDPIVQLPAVGNTIPGISGIATNYPSLDLISTLENQVWYGCFTDNKVYASQTNNYNTVMSSTTRLAGEGALLVLDAPSTGFSPQAQQMYISAGRNQWWISEKLKQTFSLSNVVVTTEILYVQRLKTAPNQGAQSQALIARFKNSLVYVSGEPILNALGLVKNVYTDPQVVNMSDSIKYDMDAYTFTGGSVYYDNYFIYLAVPANGIVRLYNVVKKYWEAPQTIPVSRFYHTSDLTPGAAIYGHSSLTNESYQLFVPNSYNDLGNPIPAVAAFPYVSSEGTEAAQKKFFNKHYTEGYIAGNTSLTFELNYDFGGFSGTYSTNISGADKKIVFNTVTDGSLGRNPLGSQPIGSILNLPNQPAIPKFRVINTFPPINCYEYQIVYSSNAVDQSWALLRFGPAIGPARDVSVEISE